MRRARTLWHSPSGYERKTLHDETVTQQAASFAELGLAEEILRAVAEAGHEHPTPIQARAIPEVLAGRNLIGIAQTGTGKTASFLLPMLQLLIRGRSRARMPRALVLSPTRELATQTARNFDLYAKYLKLTRALLIGGVGMGEQERALEKGVDVVIATPGRLLDWFERGRILLGGVEILVIDEADRMLDMGFMPDVERIIRLLIRRRQTLLFSATMPAEVRRLAETFMPDAVEVAVSPPARKAELVDDVFVPTEAERKRATLVWLLRTRDIGKAMIFCNTKREVAALTRHLRRLGFEAEDIHGDLEQSVRLRTLERFKADEVKLLVCTDVAARGLDIAELPVVINYDVPLSADDYVHRIGRTGRAGHRGRAYTLITPADARQVAAIERLTGRRVPQLELEEETAPAPPARAEQPAAAASGDAEKPQRASRRRRRGREPEPKAAAPAASPEAVPAADAPAAASAGDGEAAAASVAADVAVAEGGRRRRRRSRSGNGEGADAARAPSREEPVRGMGDHVPRFLLIPIPLRSGAKAGASR